jgi:hypothetical protein
LIAAPAAADLDAGLRHHFDAAAMSQNVATDLQYL